VDRKADAEAGGALPGDVVAEELRVQFDEEAVDGAAVGSVVDGQLGQFGVDLAAKPGEARQVDGSGRGVEDVEQAVAGGGAVEAATGAAVDRTSGEE
jgi:hypothetical protein